MNTYVWRKLSVVKCEPRTFLCKECCFYCPKLDSCIEKWTRGMFPCHKWCSQAIRMLGEILGLSQREVENIIRRVETSYRSDGYGKRRRKA